MLVAIMTAFLYLVPIGNASAATLSPMMEACYNGNYDKVKELVDKGANVNERSEHGTTPLMMAVISGNEKLVQYLIQNNADIKAKNNNGASVFGYCFLCRNDNYNIVKMLLDMGIDANNPSPSGMTSLMAASMRGYIKSMKLLLEKGANVNAKENNGYTALMGAAWSGNTESVQLLLDNGAEVNATKDDGSTPLTYAMRALNKEAADLLLSRGATAPDKLKDSAWRVEREKSPMDDSEGYTAILKSKEGNTSLLLRCAEGKPEAYINIGKYMGIDRTAVEYRFDSGRAEKEPWRISTDTKAVFAPDSFRFMKKLADSKKLAVRVVPYAENPMVSIFELNGVENAVWNVMQTCKWKK